jgi:hypothetical protein
LQEDNANLFFDDTNNRLGVGTVTPQVGLSVTGASGAQAGSGQEGIAQFTTGTGGQVDEKLQFGVVSGTYSWIQAVKPGTAARDLVLQPGGGKVGIGTTTPALKFTIGGQAAAGLGVSQICSGPNGADASTTMIQFADFAAAVQVGAITRTGTNQVAYGTSSDYRLKDDIRDTARGLAALMAIEVHDYRMGGTDQQGLLAQQVFEHYPEAVHAGGENPLLEPWMIDYGRLTPLLIKAVQQLAARVEVLERAARR